MSALATLAPYHLFAYAYSFGATSFHSFVSSTSAFKVLPRKEFGILQNRLFPIHFLTQAIGPVVVGLTAPYAIPTWGLATLGVSTASGLVNYLWLLPVCKSIKEKRIAIVEGQFEGNEEAAAQSEDYKYETKQFGKYHGLSLLFNFVSVLTITAYGFILSGNIIKSVPK